MGIASIQPQIRQPSMFVSHESSLAARVTTLALGVIASAIVLTTVQPPLPLFWLQS